MNTITIHCTEAGWQADVAPHLRILYGVARRKLGSYRDGDDRVQAAVVHFCRMLAARHAPGRTVVLAFRYSMLRPANGQYQDGCRPLERQRWAAVRYLNGQPFARSPRRRPDFPRYTDNDLLLDVGERSSMRRRVVAMTLAGIKPTFVGRMLGIHPRRVLRYLRTSLRMLGVNADA